MVDQLNLSMFRAYDIRTPAKNFPPELAARLCAAEAVYFRDVLDTDRVIVAHDARSTGPAYLEIGIETFRTAGLDVVYLPGVCSTSYFYFCAMSDPDAAAVMFGASHNPAGDTGQKLLAPKVIPIAEQIGPQGGLDRIRQLYVEGASIGSERCGKVRGLDRMSEYVRHSMKLAGVSEGDLIGLRIMMDFLNGAAGREMLMAFGLAKADLEPLHCVPNGAFPLGDPNPVKQDVIQPGLDRLRSGQFDAGFCFDGDGDRIDVYMDHGTYLASSFIYAAILPEVRDLFTLAEPRVFADLKSNPLAVIQMARSGVAVDVIRNGHSQIKMSMIDDSRYLGAVEESAHFYQAFQHAGSARFCTENTLFVALLVARVLREDRARFERMRDLQARTARQREWGYKFSDDGRRAGALEAVAHHFEQLGASSLTTMKNGLPLEATLMRRGLPFDVDQHTSLSDDWLQVCQRVSQSESGLARWEVVGANAECVERARKDTERIVKQHGGGAEYQG